MIILRQKKFSRFSDTVLDWAKKFTPRIPIGNTRLYILWPGTIIGALVGVFKGLADKFKHGTSNNVGKPCTEHELEHTSKDVFKERKFSDVDLESTFEDYCNIIPGYKSLAYLNNLNFELLKGTSEDYKKTLWTYFPSFFVLSRPNEINDYRRDYLSDDDPQDYAEILFMYGDELIFLWDFNRENWYVLDKTYTPKKEWKITNGKEGLRDVLLNMCDPEKDALLKHRISAAKDQEMVKIMENYCKTLRMLIEKAFKY